MPVFRLWDVTRQHRKVVVAATLQEQISIGMTPFNLKLSINCLSLELMFIFSEGL